MGWKEYNIRVLKNKNEITTHTLCTSDMIQTPYLLIGGKSSYQLSYALCLGVCLNTPSVLLWYMLCIYWIINVKNILALCPNKCSMTLYFTYQGGE